MSFNERANSNESLKIKVDRYNSKTNTIRRFFGLGKHNNRKEELRLTDFEGFHGYLTAIKKPYNRVTGLYENDVVLAYNKHNLMTDTGVTFLATQGYDTTAHALIVTNGGNYIALSGTSQAGGGARTDTALSGEVDNTNGFGRTQGAVVIGSGGAASGGSISLTVTNTFQATGAVGSPGLQSSGLFTGAVGASPTPVMMHEANFTATTFAINDKLQIIWTITLSS